MEMYVRKALALGLVLVSSILLVGNSFAAGVASIKGNDANQTSMTVEYLDSSKVRMNVSQQGRDSYMLVRDGRAYSVTNSSGRMMVMDMAQLGSMARSMGANMGGSDAFKQELLEYKKTGKSEKVAGYTGDVYSLTWRDSRGTHTEDAVLSGNSSVREFSQAWMTMAKTMASSMGQSAAADNSIWQFLQREQKGVLRLGKEFRVTSLQTKKLDASRFDLPAAPMQMPGLGAAAAQNNAQAAQGTENSDQSMSSFWGSMVGKKTERQVDRQQNRAEGHVDRQVDRAVDRAVGDALNSIFGR